MPENGYFFLSFHFLEFWSPWVFFGCAQKKACTTDNNEKSKLAQIPNIACYIFYQTRSNNDFWRQKILWGLEIFLIVDNGQLDIQCTLLSAAETKLDSTQTTLDLCCLSLLLCLLFMVSSSGGGSGTSGALQNSMIAVETDRMESWTNCCSPRKSSSLGSVWGSLDDWLWK